MSSTKPASWLFAEQFHTEAETLLDARDRGEELGCPAIEPGSAALLRAFAATLSARAVVEIGTGVGVSGVWMLQGMAPDGVLTTIDIEAEHQRIARDTFAACDIRPNRVRMITGRGVEVLPRLSDGAYDMVVHDADRTDLEEYLERAIRLLRPGGVFALHHALLHDQVADPAHRDEATKAVREFSRLVRDDERLVSALVPSGDGVLVAVKRPTG